MKINAKYAYTTPSTSISLLPLGKNVCLEQNVNFYKYFRDKKSKATIPVLATIVRKKKALEERSDAIKNHTAGQSVVITITLKSNKVKDESQSTGEGPPKSHYPFSNFVRQ